jgi:PAS domain S-box-containing protein
MTIQLTELARDDLSQLALDLDPQDREQKKAQRVYRLNVRQIPLLRLFGFGLVLLGVLLHNLFLSHSFSWPSFVHLVLIVVSYTLLSWLLLSLLYARVKLLDVGVFFLVADVFVWTVAIYFAGGEKSWLFFILMMRVADQVNTSFKRALSFAHLPVLSYGLMLLYISAVDQRWISWPAEATKMLYIYGANLYIALAARPAEQCRGRTAAAVRLARELILRLTEKSRQLEEAKVSWENLNHQNDMILQAAGEGICGIDGQGNTTFVNPAAVRLTEWQAEELVDKPLHAFLHYAKPDGAFYPWAECPVYATLQHGTVRHGEDEVFWRKDGTSFPVEYTSSPIRERGKLVGAVLVFRDISERSRTEEMRLRAVVVEAINRRLEKEIAERKQAELALSRAKETAEVATRAKSEFLAALSHELRTPLNVILGYSNLLAEGEFGSLTNEQDETLERIRRNAFELHDLITSVLDLSRLEAGRLPVNITEVQVAALLKELKAETQEAYRRLPLHFSWEVEGEFTPIYTDPQKLKVVLRNLIGNAVKFTPQGGITVKASAKSGGVEVSVADTGVGIPPEALEIIFEPFRQADGTAAGQGKGVGLGLHIVKRLLELLGGTVGVESEVGRGSTFMVWVPARGSSPRQ